MAEAPLLDGSQVWSEERLRTWCRTVGVTDEQLADPDTFKFIRKFVLREARITTVRNEDGGEIPPYVEDGTYENMDTLPRIRKGRRNIANTPGPMTRSQSTFGIDSLLQSTGASSPQNHSPIHRRRSNSASYHTTRVWNGRRHEGDSVSANGSTDRFMNHTSTLPSGAQMFAPMDTTSPGTTLPSMAFDLSVQLNLSEGVAFNERKKVKDKRKKSRTSSRLQNQCTHLQVELDSTKKRLMKLKDEVTCSICLDIWKNPKTLPCDHVFCNDCLVQLVHHSTRSFATGYATVKCPECRREHSTVADQWSNSWLTSRHLIALTESVKNMS